MEVDDGPQKRNKMNFVMAVTVLFRDFFLVFFMTKYCY